jgi:hypothetical protein
MPNLAESFLALFAGRDRAAAIMGDLEELAATRGRLWFWINYFRALISLGWRTPVAFVAGFSGFLLLMAVLSAWVRSHGASVTAHRPPSGIPAKLIFLATMFLASFSLSLWFAAPFAILRFGFRDRMAQLYGVFFLLAAPVFFHSNRVALLCALMTVAVIVAALVSEPWRRPMIVIAAMSVAVVVCLTTCSDLAAKIYHPHFHLKAGPVAMGVSPVAFNPVSWFAVRLTFAIALLIAAVVCSLLHRWLLRQRPAIA